MHSLLDKLHFVKCISFLGKLLRIVKKKYSFLQITNFVSFTITTDHLYMFKGHRCCYQLSEGTGFPVPYWHSSMAYLEVSPPYLFSSACKHSVTHLIEYRHLLIWKKDKLFHHITIPAAKCLTEGNAGHSMLGLINQSTA